MMAGATLLNFALFQIAWFVCVSAGDRFAVFATLLVLLVHVFYIKASPYEWRVIALFALGGMVFDTLLQNLRLVDFSAAIELQRIELIPVWLMCLWILFATTLAHSLAWMTQRWALAALFGFVAAPFSYYVGTRLSGSEVMQPVAYFLLEGVFWALYFPLGLTFANRISSYKP